MQTLKLQKFYIENMRFNFPKFPFQMEKTTLSGSLTARVIIYLHKVNKNNFALKLEMSYFGKKKNTKKAHFIIQSTMVGLFKRLDENKTIKSLGSTIGKDMLYEKMREKFSTILSHVPITGVQLPTRIKK